MNEPGLVHEAYTRFHTYSLHNQLLALAQCALSQTVGDAYEEATSPSWSEDRAPD